MISRLLRRIRQLFQRDDLDEEMELHRAMVEDAQRSQGLSEEDARYAARRLMGNTTQAREEARRIWLAGWIEGVWQDLRYAARSLKNQPAFTFMALLALVLGIGLNTSLFTAVNGTLLRPWNVPDANEVVNVISSHPRFGFGGLPIATVAYFNENSRTIEGAAAGHRHRMTLDDAQVGKTVSADFVSGGYFRILRIGMAMGRGFDAAEDVPGAPVAVGVLSNLLWKEKYASDPAIIGRTIRLDGVPFTVIGVAQDSFAGTSEDRTDLWAPLASLTLAQPNDPNNLARLTDPNHCCSGISARLRSGITRERAQDELNALYRQFSANAQRSNISVVLTGTAMLDHPGRKRQATRAIAMLFVTFGSILLLACANVSNLLLARATARQREIAVRVAIGAGRWRVIRQLLTESLLLAAIASGGGLVLAFVLPNLVFSLMNQELPTNMHFTPDGNVLVYAMAISIVTALAFGLAPALRGTRIAVSDAMKHQSPNASARFPLRGVLLGVQVTISVALLMAAGLLARGLERARSLDLGFQTEGVTALQVLLPRNAYDAARERAFFDDLVGQLQAGGDPVGMASLMPMGNARNLSGFAVAGVHPDATTMMPFQSVSAGYFDVLKIPILMGRGFRPGVPESGVILVNESLVRQYWPDRSPIGQSVTIGERKSEVIGVVRDSQVYGIGTTGPMYFAPFARYGNAAEPPILLLPSSLAAQAVAAVRAADATATTAAIPLSELVDDSLGDSAGIARLAGALGLLALMLATVGVYGVISYSVEQRQREIGIRMALGARPLQVVGMVLRKNARAVGVGLAVGLLIAIGESFVLESELYGLSPADPLAYAGVLTLLLVAAAAACVIPARRAARTDAVTALHHE